MKLKRIVGSGTVLWSMMLAACAAAEEAAG